YGLIRYHDVGLSGVASANDDLTLAAQDVSSSRGCTYPAPRPVESGFSGEARRIPSRIHQPHLAVLEHGIGPHHDPEGLLGSGSLGDEIQAAFAICGVAQALGGHRANAGPAPGDNA